MELYVAVSTLFCPLAVLFLATALRLLWCSRWWNFFSKI